MLLQSAQFDFHNSSFIIGEPWTLLLAVGGLMFIGFIIIFAARRNRGLRK